jgi:ribose-phosphate pyrophosphokinase
MVVAGFAETRNQSQQLAAVLGCNWVGIEVHRFPDSESRVTVPVGLYDDVIVHRSLDHPNDKLVELALAAETLRSEGCRRLLLVAPYLCYMRQDTAFHPGEAVSQRIIGRWLGHYFDGLITVDPHLHRVARLGEVVPLAAVASLSAAPLFGHHLAARSDRPLLLGPDAESRQWVEAIATESGSPWAVANKRRFGDHEVELVLPENLPQASSVILVDDVVSTGCTLTELARQLAGRGVKRLEAWVTHALFVEGALERLHESGVAEVLSTDSVTHSSNGIPLAGLLATAVRDLIDSPLACHRVGG